MGSCDERESCFRLRPESRGETSTRGGSWDDLAASPTAVPVHDWQKMELARRKANLMNNPASGLSLDEVKQRVRTRYARSVFPGRCPGLGELAGLRPENFRPITPLLQASRFGARACAEIAQHVGELGGGQGQARVGAAVIETNRIAAACPESSRRETRRRRRPPAARRASRAKTHSSLRRRTRRGSSKSSSASPSRYRHPPAVIRTPW